jgi:hypothetical protein
MYIFCIFNKQKKTQKMKNLTIQQIEQIKKIGIYDFHFRYHGNKKKDKILNVSDIKIVSEKKYKREMNKFDNNKLSPVQKTKELISFSKNFKDSNYFKIMVAGNKNIYLASPICLHNDYNKSIVFPKNEKTIRLMQIFNKIVNK